MEGTPLFLLRGNDPLSDLLRRTAQGLEGLGREPFALGHETEQEVWLPTSGFLSRRASSRAVSIEHQAFSVNRLKDPVAHRFAAVRGEVLLRSLLSSDSHAGTDGAPGGARGPCLVDEVER